MMDDHNNDAFAVDIAGTATVVRRANWPVCQDVAHETWNASGYATGTPSNYVYTLINPVTLRQFDPRGKLLAQIEAVRSSTAGKLLPTDSFAQSAYTAWTTWTYTDCCFVSSLRVYHTITASGAGISGVNYSETTYGYDSLKRRNRVVSPGSTSTRVVHDVRDNVIGTYVGTNDTGATANNPTAGGSGGNNMIPTGVLNFAAGETTKTITLRVLRDLVGEANEGFIVTLSTPSAGTIQISTATDTITNDD